jgi:glutathione synthase/RimK-type ligase-like ATP-grasp enzyme
MGGNTPVEFLLAESQFEVVAYYLDHNQPDDTNPVLSSHDVAFCAVPADAEDADQLYDLGRRITRNTGKPVLNLPDTLVKPERDALPDILAGIAGVRVSKTAREKRSVLDRMLNDKAEDAVLKDVGRYPYVVRPIGSHAGLGLCKIETPTDFESYLQVRDEDTFFVSEFINYASTKDRAFRKYRIVLIDGKPYPCHMAISDQWDVWYMNSNMAKSQSKRREEADYMNGFDMGNGRRHRKGFEAIAERLGCDYVGLDCAEDPDGNLVVFEADNALIVHNMDCVQTFPYKGAHMQRIFSAFATLLADNCRDPRHELHTAQTLKKAQSHTVDHALV